MSDLAVDRLCVSLGGRPVVRDASWRLRAGELVALLGANGAGKTTVLRAVLGLTPRVSGEVRVGEDDERPASRHVAAGDPRRRHGRVGEDQRPTSQPRTTTERVSGDARVGGDDPARMSPSARARCIAYLPQARPLAWPVRVRDVVALGRFAYGGTPDRLAAADEEAVARAVRACDLEPFVERSCATLSGGELARVHVARTLAAEAPFLLADEPTAALDPLHQHQVMQLLRTVADAGCGVLVVMHDAALAARIADRLLWMADGRIVADGPPEATLTPARLAEVYGVDAAVRRVQRDWLISVTGTAPRRSSGSWS